MAESDDPRRIGRLGIENWVKRHPNTNVTVVISAHSSAEGLLAHAYPAAKSSKTPQNAGESCTPWDVTPSKVSTVEIYAGLFLTLQKILIAALGRTLATVMGTTGVKTVIALTCGQTFKVVESLHLWQELLGKGYAV